LRRTGFRPAALGVGQGMFPPVLSSLAHYRRAWLPSGLLADVPVTTLAAALLLVAARIFQARQLYAIARFQMVEFVLAAVTQVTVALIGVEQGIGVAVALAILDRTARSAAPTRLLEPWSSTRSA
jgi:MFS superfamily sulfate permease-like transporter